MTSRPKICLIYTGGTIGMVDDKVGGRQPPRDPSRFLAQIIHEIPDLERMFEFKFVNLMNKDSTNVNHKDWSLMANAINDLMDDDSIAGFVVAHGTDTMHFSASAVAFALGLPLPRPVVFTGAQTIPSVYHGDARVNFLRACQVALEDLGEVVIAFGDYVFRGCRAQKKDEARFNAFESPAIFELGYITEQIALHPERERRSTDRRSDFRPEFADGILQVSLIPGLEAELVAPAIREDACHGVILQSFGAGNVPNDDEYSFLGLIEECVALDKPLIVTSQFPANSTLHSAYAPGRRAREAGAIATSNMTASCAVAKFRWALAQGEGRGARVDRVKRIMGTMYVEEMDEEQEED